MNKPTKPNVNVPESFAEQGVKADFTAQKIQNGFSQIDPDVLAGDNLNKFIDDTYKSITYTNAGVSDLYRSAVTYDEEETYYNNSLIFDIDEDGKVTLYRSLADDNTGNPLNDNEYWEEIQLGAVRNIGEIVYSSLPLTDSKLHLLDGSLISGDGMYKEFVEHIAKIYTQNPKANCFTDEASWQSSISKYKVCGKFVYDSDSNTVRLPKVTGLIEGTIDSSALGSLVEAGLPNISGSFNFADNILKNHAEANYAQSPTGVFRCEPVTKNACEGTATVVQNTTSTNGKVTFTASYSNSLYGKSTTVQPQTIKAYLYIVVGTSSKTDIQANIDYLATDLNGKADVDLGNITDNATDLISRIGMPSDKYVDLSLGVTGTVYTAPANGYLVIGKQTPPIMEQATRYIRLLNKSTMFGAHSITGDEGATLRVYLPARKGDKISVEYDATGDTLYFRFVYGEGAL